MTFQKKIELKFKGEPQNCGNILFRIKKITYKKFGLKFKGEYKRIYKFSGNILTLKISYSLSTWIFYFPFSQLI